MTGSAAALAALALGAAAGPAAAADAGGRATLQLDRSAPATKSLAKAGVRLTARGSATASGRRLVLPVASARLSGRARIDHGGRLIASRGRRSVALRSLRTSLGAKPRISARIGGKRVTVFALRGSRPVLDSAAGTASARRMRLTLTRRGATVLRKQLRVRRLRPGRLGRAHLSARWDVAGTRPSPPPADPGAPAPAPAPAPPPAPPAPPAPDPEPTPTPTPDPDPEPQEPVGSTDWIATTLPGSGDLKSFINYLTRPWPAVPPATESGPGRVVASDGAAPMAAGNIYDYRLEVTEAGGDGSGAVSIVHRGKLAYQLPAHSIDLRVEDPEVVIEPGGGSGRLIADGQYNSRESAGAPPEPYTDEHLLDLELAGIAPEAGPDDTRIWRDVPAAVAESGADELGYPAGTAWGSLTITVPAAGTQPGPAAVTGTSRLGVRPSWLSYISMVPPAGTITADGGTTRSEDGSFASALTGSYEHGTRTGTVDLPGSVRYAKPAHGIDITVRDPQVTIAGAGSTLTAVVVANGTDHGRIPLATLDLAATAPAETAGAVTWTDVQALFTEQGAAVFSYAPGDEYGLLTLTLQTP